MRLRGVVYAAMLVLGLALLVVATASSIHSIGRDVASRDAGSD